MRRSIENGWNKLGFIADKNVDSELPGQIRWDFSETLTFREQM